MGAVLAAAAFNLLLVFAFLAPTRAAVAAVVREKELRLREGMRIFGLQVTILWRLIIYQLFIKRELRHHDTLSLIGWVPSCYSAERVCVLPRAAGMCAFCTIRCRNGRPYAHYGAALARGRVHFPPTCAYLGLSEALLPDCPAGCLRHLVNTVIRASTAFTPRVS